MSEVKLLNMCMIYDEKTDKVLVQERIKKDWPGITFPGGHVEDGESLVQSTIREVKEETGLDVSQLKLKGVIHWSNIKDQSRWMIFLYKTTVFSGEKLDVTREGKVFWVDYDKLETLDLADGFRHYLKVFSSDTYSEAFGTWDDILINDFIML